MSHELLLGVLVGAVVFWFGFALGIATGNLSRKFP